MEGIDETFLNQTSKKMDTVGFEPTTSRKSDGAKRARYPCAKSPCPSQPNGARFMFVFVLIAACVIT